MATPYISLEDVSFVLPNGEILFSHVNEHFGQCPTGLVGRNGSGKSVLARILAGQLHPTQGRCVRSGAVHYLAQQVSAQDGTTVTDLAGLRGVFDALQRIENGSCAQADFDLVDSHWDAPAQLANALAQEGLGHLDAHAPASALSGGESMRVALVGAVLSNADFLILDEPSNHLDQPSRLRLIEWLQQWRKGLLVISHDRQLLAAMARIVELSSLGLRSYGGNYAFYANAKAQEQQHALNDLERARLERKREEQALRDQRERQEKRQARAARSGKEANQAKSLLDHQKERSDQSMGKLQRQQTQTRTELAQRVRHAAAQVAEDVHIHLHAPMSNGVAQRQVLALDYLELPPFVPPPLQHISLQVNGQQRIGLIGPNGIGKSTLLKVIAGRIDALSGLCKVTGRVAYLDQRLDCLDAKRSTIEVLQDVNRRLSENELRMRLAQLGMDAQKIAVPTDSLSGGERLKAALACVIYADEPPQLLLLDEPSNHLDLPSLAALEALLTGYGGALIVTSHDQEFLKRLRLTDLLHAGSNGWNLKSFEDSLQ
ncbi:ABC-F family ATP-binding cassette domain-containing protein [Pollutimonas harenae]|uniref:ABC-F family ATP-binding cassette domain-containing protein n=1 Tax=Pollutimonas harenae TaxID=657015 RepID=A0A853H403_9BURK|nr:ABC-F family ATP-binding cassette domain-containing protein [Pollutimonas harenae]NYT85293.1 ABC-F family ATP-binding cassette domain-containing protein [Pollutimonas harenae]TEA72343.1 ABC-F family ATP-binding cassette domain-containing protein [Pollutimonas harenae]